MWCTALLAETPEPGMITNRFISCIYLHFTRLPVCAGADARRWVLNRALPSTEVRQSRDGGASATELDTIGTEIAYDAPIDAAAQLVFASFATAPPNLHSSLAPHQRYRTSLNSNVRSESGDLPLYMKSTESAAAPQNQQQQQRHRTSRSGSATWTSAARGSGQPAGQDAARQLLLRGTISAGEASVHERSVSDVRFQIGTEVTLDVDAQPEPSDSEASQAAAPLKELKEALPRLDAGGSAASKVKEALPRLGWNEARSNYPVATSTGTRSMQCDNSIGRQGTLPRNVNSSWTSSSKHPEVRRDRRACNTGSNLGPTYK